VIATAAGFVPPEQWPHEHVRVRGFVAGDVQFPDHCSRCGRRWLPIFDAENEHAVKLDELKAILGVRRENRIRAEKTAELALDALRKIEADAREEYEAAKRSDNA
jgi:hypothetical protein